MTEAAVKTELSQEEMMEKVKAQIKEEQKLYGKAELVIEGVNPKHILKALKANEVGDAWLLESLLQERLCYDHAAGQWYTWNEHHWIEDTVKKHVKAVESVVEEYAKEVRRQAWIRISATKSGDSKKATEAEKLEDKLIRRINELRALHRRRNVLFLASCGSDSLGISGEEWDKDPYLLGCANGVVDLRTGDFRDGSPDDYILNASPTEWKGLDRPAPTWIEFLMEIFDEDEEFVDYIQRLFGYSIAGLCTEHIMPVFYGEGRNGKGTLFEVISNVLGPIAGPIPSEMLMSQGRLRSSAGPSPDIMKLRGRRIAWASETNEDRFFDIGKVKWMVGGDTLTGRPMYGRRQVEFQPTHTLFLLTNHKPHVSADEYAMWQRLHLIPFTKKFVDDPDPEDRNQLKRDPNMPTKLIRESEGILAWLVRGFLAWQEAGELAPPGIIREATKEYQSEEDILGHFVGDSCESKSGGKVRAKDLYAAFKIWCQENGHKPMSNTKFGRKLGNRLERGGDTEGRFYKGIRIRPRYIPHSF